MLQKELGEWSKAADLIDRASTLYMEHGTGDTAIITLSRGAKLEYSHFLVRNVLHRRAFVSYFNLVKIILLFKLYKMSPLKFNGENN